MFFFVLFLVGLIFPLLLIKVKPGWVVWLPAMVLSFAAIVMFVKAEFFPGEGMAELADRLYIMIFGLTAIGSLLGGIIIHFLRNK